MRAVLTSMCQLENVQPANNRLVRMPVPGTAHPKRSQLRARPLDCAD